MPYSKKMQGDFESLALEKFKEAISHCESREELTSFCRLLRRTLSPPSSTQNSATNEDKDRIANLIELASDEGFDLYATDEVVSLVHEDRSDVTRYAARIHIPAFTSDKCDPSEKINEARADYNKIICDKLLLEAKKIENLSEEAKVTQVAELKKIRDEAKNNQDRMQKVPPPKIGSGAHVLSEQQYLLEQGNGVDFSRIEIGDDFDQPPPISPEEERNGVHLPTPPLLSAAYQLASIAASISASTILTTSPRSPEEERNDFSSMAMSAARILAISHVTALAARWAFNFLTRPRREERNEAALAEPVESDNMPANIRAALNALEELTRLEPDDVRRETLTSLAEFIISISQQREEVVAAPADMHNRRAALNDLQELIRLESDDARRAALIPLQELILPTRQQRGERSEVDLAAPAAPVVSSRGAGSNSPHRAFNLFHLSSQQPSDGNLTNQNDSGTAPTMNRPGT